MNRRAFTILETTIALAILVGALTILISSQGSSILMTHDADNVRTATMLAEEKIIEAQLGLEKEGWTTRDINKDGDFSDIGKEDFRGGESHDFDDMQEQLERFKWAYTIRKIELTIPPNLPGLAEQLGESGYFGEQPTDQLENNTVDISDFITPDQLSEHLSKYIREVRVKVWWGEDEEDEENQVEILTHVINPSGAVTDPDEEDTQ